jgi:aryl-alcohol dehydrogenase-like predicted oxidoreductase
MEMRALGRSGLRVSVIGLGCNNFGGRIGLPETRAVVHKALDLGVTLFDTADSYGNRGGSEQFLGEILGERRKDVVLATKFGMPVDAAVPRTSRRYIMMAIEASLRRLKTDWIDLYQLHRPDPSTPIEETLRALDDLIHQGKVRYIGNSNLAAWQAVDAHWTSLHRNLNRFISCQNEYSLVARGIEKELIPAMQACGLGLLPYFPLAGGLLTGKYQRSAPMPSGARLSSGSGLAVRYLTEKNWSIVERLSEFCKRRGHGLIDLAFNWLLAQPTLASVIAGATRPEQLEQNVKAAGRALTPEDLTEVDQLTRSP